MKYFLILVLMLLPLVDATAQKKKKANSKTATVVDSMSAPPRMDGNTGKYDTVKYKTVREPRKRAQDNVRKTDVHYNMGADTIIVAPK
jgi:hypothetical protein